MPHPKTVLLFLKRTSYQPHVPAQRLDHSSILLSMMGHYHGAKLLYVACKFRSFFMKCAIKIYHLLLVATCVNSFTRYLQLNIYYILLISPNKEHCLLYKAIWSWSECQWFSGIDSWIWTLENIKYIHYSSPITIRWRQGLHLYLSSTIP